MNNKHMNLLLLKRTSLQIFSCSCTKFPLFLFYACQHTKIFLKYHCPDENFQRESVNAPWCFDFLQEFNTSARQHIIADLAIKLKLCHINDSSFVSWTFLDSHSLLWNDSNLSKASLRKKNFTTKKDNCKVYLHWNVESKVTQWIEKFSQSLQLISSD